MLKKADIEELKHRAPELYRAQREKAEKRQLRRKQKPKKKGARGMKKKAKKKVKIETQEQLLKRVREAKEPKGDKYWDVILTWAMSL